MTTRRPQTLPLATCLFAMLVAASGHASPIQWTTGSGGNGHYYDVVSVPAGITWSGASAAAIADNISAFGTAVISYVIEWDGPTSVREPDPSILLMRASPNPFSGSTRISFVAPGAGPVEVGIFDVSGRLVRDLSSAGAGRDHQIEWDGETSRGERVPSGIYFCRIATGSGYLVGRLVLIR